jgi:hypothetical protein
MIDLILLAAWEVVLEAGFQGLCYLTGGVSRLEASLTFYNHTPTSYASVMHDEHLDLS